MNKFHIKGYENNTHKSLLRIITLSIALIIILPTIISANSAEPPSLIILVNRQPDDFSLTLVSDEHSLDSQYRKVAWESYYLFYSMDLNSNNNYKVIVTSNGDTFECPLSQNLNHYNNVFTLDLSTKKLTPGKYPFRTVLLVSIRLLLTLIIEGFIFWLFKYRRKRSWAVFFFINLITQGILNAWLLNQASILAGYLIIALVFGEIFVFVTEMILLPILIDEHKKRRTIIYAFIANFISLILGGYLIALLPV